MKKRFVFISNMAAPYQVRFCAYLQEYFETEFWFYEYMGSSRPKWWKIDLPSNCKVIGHLLYKRNERYVTFEVLRMLRAFDPDVVMLGGAVIPSNYLAYRWAKRHGKKTIFLTETHRKNGKLRERSVWTKLLDLVYRDVDALFAVHDVAAEQMRSLYPRMGKVTHVAPHGLDFERYYEHPLRERKPGYTYIFPNRLIEIYNPLLAIEIFADIHARYPQSVLKLNAQGTLLSACQTLIKSLGIDDSVQFVGEIKHWDDLSAIYRECDILLFPAKFSNGNQTIFECMASGMGIVISNRILSHEIRDGKNGFVREADKAQFLEAVQRYIDDPGLLGEHAIAGRDMARPFTGAEIAKHWAKLIHEQVLRDA